MSSPARSFTDLGNGLERLWANRWLRIVGILAGFAAVTVVLALTARARMFSGFAGYDDEGYMLTSIKSFIHRGALYNETFSQYGPFFSELWGGFFSLFGIGVTHDSGRTVTTVVWVGSSLGLGLVTMRLARSLLLGLGTQVIAFTVLGIMINEPMHPGGLVAMLLVVILAIACFVGERRSLVTMYLLGIAVAALALTKVNVGGFALISLALACAVSYPVLLRRRWVRPLVEAIFVATPIVLMASKFGETWAVQYSLHVAIAALAVVIVLRARQVTERPWSDELGGLLLGFVAFAVLVLFIALATGTTPAGLWEGMVSLPLHQGDAFTLPLHLAEEIWIFDGVALLAACGYWFLRRRGELAWGWNVAIAAFSVAVGVEMGLTLLGRSFPSLPLDLGGGEFAMLGFAWVALIPLGREDPRVAFGRLLLPLLATLQALHAFPVAGSQTGWSVFLLSAVAALCVGNGVRGFAAVGRALDVGWERWAGIALVGLATVLAAQFLIHTELEEPLDTSRSVYASHERLGLPGSNTIRLEPGEAATLRHVTAAIDRSCGDFLTEPGLGSFYLWTEREPPTGLFATAWTTLFDDELQERVIDETKGIKGLCLVRNVLLAESWSFGPIPPGPLVIYLEEGFEPVAKVGTYEILRRPGYGASH